MQTSKIIIIAGPTASGKSGLSMDLAKSLNGVIINADSMQVYKDIPILAATPSKKDQQQVPHKLYSIYDASYHGNVVEWATLCKEEIKKAFSNNEVPIITGGTGMYIEALTQGLTPIPETSIETRNNVDEMLKDKGLDYLYQYLEKIDPETHSRLAPNDTTRIRRAIEIYLDTQKTLTYWHSVPLKTFYPKDRFIKVYINPSRPELDTRLRKRFDIMIEKGAVDEVRELLKKNLKDTLPSMRALGVPELKLYLEHKLTLEEAIALAKLHTRQYAKRQSTWFNNRFKQDHLYTSCYEHDNFFVDDIKKTL
ncbi:MAG: tRNA (adenosine(37)-N6)-dimethylallyltransferase MiaA [Alphaproteobacteria bacterium]|nr:tRNA (adenosine(37)-N6)-dimethylallyltransferase MiaA [Alphaproteobacteria bacterium]